MLAFSKRVHPAASKGRMRLKERHPLILMPNFLSHGKYLRCKVLGLLVLIINLTKSSHLGGVSLMECIDKASPWAC